MSPVSRENANRLAHLSVAARALDRSLRRVRTEQALAVKDFAPEPIHDLRVALRRCRSLAEGFSVLNPQPGWRHLRRACKELLRGLAELRDAQVMDEWVRRLGLNKGRAGAALVADLARGQRHGQRAARRALADFSGKRWKRWRRRLPWRAARITADDAHFARLALRRLAEACALERRWRKSRSGKAAHQLRVGLKRFRYLVESFLPQLRAAWGRDLKRLQSLLGDVHDLDVLRARIVPLSRGENLPSETREAWVGKIEKARGEAVEEYWRGVVLKPAFGRPGDRPRTLWDRWQKKLTQLAGVTFPIAAGPSRSVSRRASPAARKDSRYPGRPRRLSAGL